MAKKVVRKYPVEFRERAVRMVIERRADPLQNYGAIASIAKPVEHLPANMTQHMAKNDFQWAATNRARILAEWEKRYGAKSEPKK